MSTRRRASATTWSCERPAGPGGTARHRSCPPAPGSSPLLDELGPRTVGAARGGRPVQPADHDRHRQRPGRAGLGATSDRIPTTPAPPGLADRRRPRRAQHRSAAATRPRRRARSRRHAATPPRTSPPPWPCCPTSSRTTRSAEPRQRPTVRRSSHSSSSPAPCGPSPSRASSRSWASASSTRSSSRSPTSSAPRPSQVSLLFTSYMAVMGVAMLITGVVSSAHRRQAHAARSAWC